MGIDKVFLVSGLVCLIALVVWTPVFFEAVDNLRTEDLLNKSFGTCQVRDLYTQFDGVAVHVSFAGRLIIDTNNGKQCVIYECSDSRLISDCQSRIN